MSLSPGIRPHDPALSGLAFSLLPSAPRASGLHLPSDPSTPLFERESSFSAARCSPAPSSCSHGSGSSHPPNSRSRKRRFSFVDGPSLDNSVGDNNSRVHNWDDGQRSQESLAEPPTPVAAGLVPRALDPSDFSPNQMERLRMEKRKENQDASRRFRARKRNEAQLEGQVMALQREYNRLRETIEHQNDRIQRQEEYMESQTSSMFYLSQEKTHYHSERDFFREELCRFIPLDQLPPRPATPYEPSKALPRPEDLGEDVLIKYLSGNTNEPQRPPLETQSAHSAFPPFPPLPPRSFDTRDSISTEKSGPQIQSQSTRELSELFSQSQDPPRYDQRAYGYRDFLLNGNANVPSSSPNPFLKLDSPSYSGVGQSMPAKRKHETTHRPVRCDVPGCHRMTGFAGQHGLDLHKRVVHSNEHQRRPRAVYRCFGKNCPRPYKRWPRLEILKEHIARMHADESFHTLLEESEIPLNPGFQT